MTFSSLNVVANAKTRTKVVVGVCTPLVFLAVLGAVSFLSISRSMESNRWVQHTYDVLAEASSIVGSAVDMETGMRGFLLAGEEAFLDPYKNGEVYAYQHIAALQETVSDNPKQVARLQAVEETLREWQANITEPMIAMRREVGKSTTMDSVASLVAEARGKVYFDKFRGLMSDFKAEEAALMEARKADNQKSSETTFALIGICLAIGGVLGLGMAWFTGRSIANPLIKMTDVMGRLAGGELDVDIEGSDRADEIGDMAKTVLIFRDNAQEVERLKTQQEQAELRAEQDKKTAMDNLASSFEEAVFGVVERVASSAKDMQTVATQVSGTAVESEGKASEVAANAQQTSANVQAMAAAVEEMTVALSEVSQQVTTATQLTSEASNQASATNTQIKSLVTTAEKVGDVVSLISDIADQTNLLALNATIEAARAGDAGKGFAVVASEVKSLANQTNRATDEIGQLIGEMQSATGESASAIEAINESVSNVNNVAAAIAAAVEEQNATTSEISNSVQEAARGTQAVTDTIGMVASAASETGKASTQVVDASNQLNEDSATLKTEVENFIANVRAS